MFYFFLLSIACVALVLAWRKRGLEPWKPDSCAAELAESKRALIRGRIVAQRAISIVLMLLGLVSLVLAAMGVGSAFFSPMAVMYPAISYWVWRIAGRREAAEVLLLLPAEHAPPRQRERTLRTAKHIQQIRSGDDAFMHGAKVAARAWIDAGVRAGVLEN